MDVLITGVAGFIGSHIAKRFISEGYNVIGVDDLSSGSLVNVPKEVDFFNINLENSDCLKKIPSGCKLILHLAGQSSGEISYHYPAEDLKKNTISTLNLIKYGIENRIDKFLYASSMSVYGDANSLPNGIKENIQLKPKSSYGIGKLASEKYLDIYKDKFPYVSLRMFNVYGPGQDMENMKQGMLSIYLSQAIKYKEILVKGSLSRFRDFIYIDDVVEAWFRASLFEECLCHKINIGTGEKTSVDELIQIIKKVTTVSKVIVKGETPCDQLGIFSNNVKFLKLLKFNPKINLNDGIKKFYDWAIIN